MKGLHTGSSVDDVRKRLYDRGSEVEKVVKHQLSDTKVEVSRDWKMPGAGKTQTTDLRSGLDMQSVETNLPFEPELPPEEPPKPKHHYRAFVLIGSLIIFVFVAVITSLFLYFGGNQISGNNIQIAIQGPSSVGGGEVAPLQVSIANHNDVPVESVVLIMKYPQGTQSTDSPPRMLFEERIPVDSIAPGEVKNIPVKVAIFGEEQAEKSVSATVEYRIGGSNGTFYKDSEPLSFHITSSPLVLRVENVEKVASGQLIDVNLSLVSNASSPLHDVLVSASYPTGFSYEKADPEPVYGQNVWKIKELLPEQTVNIKLQGITQGYTDDNFRINFTAGPAKADNQYVVDSVLAQSYADFTIERPFIGIDLGISGQTGSNIVLSQGDPSAIYATIRNTLSETVYDVSVEMKFEGNVMNGANINTRGSTYDPVLHTIRWVAAEDESLVRMLPGDHRQFAVEMVSGPQRATASYDVTVNVYARRVNEPNAQEFLIGSTQATVKFSSEISVASQVGRNVGQFTDTGPIPPVVGEDTTYSISVIAEAGVNDVSDAEVQIEFPGYVEWLGQQAAGAGLDYNPISKQLIWKVGDLSANQRKELPLQVRINPSQAQAKSTPVLINAQQFKATDRFSGALLQDTGAAVTTELSTEMGFPRGNGIVVGR